MLQRGSNEGGMPEKIIHRAEIDFHEKIVLQGSQITSQTHSISSREPECFYFCFRFHLDIWHSWFIEIIPHSLVILSWLVCCSAHLVKYVNLPK